MESKLNITALRASFPKGVEISKHDLSDLKRQLGIQKPTVDDSKLFVDTYLANLTEQKTEKIKQAKIEREISELYRFCTQWKIDCYAACCRFIEYKHSLFIDCPERIPVAPHKEASGHFYNKIMCKTGYFKQSSADILEEKNINKKHVNHRLSPVEYVFYNHKQEFKVFVSMKKKVLNKHVRSQFVDFSSMAYNGCANDL